MIVPIVVVFTDKTQINHSVDNKTEDQYSGKEFASKLLALGFSALQGRSQRGEPRPLPQFNSIQFNSLSILPQYNTHWYVPVWRSTRSEHFSKKIT